jgi:DNA-binding cell septation regulator SpoVG
MRDDLRITQVHLSAARDEELRKGTLGRVRMVVNGLVVQGVCLRRTLDGRLTLVYPARRDDDGERLVVVRPIDDDARLAIEVQVFTALGIKAEERAG